MKLRLIIAIYVDDFLNTGDSLAEIDAAKHALSNRFQLSDLGLYKYYLGMTLSCNRPYRVLRLGQRTYFEVEVILPDHKMTDCKAAPTSMETQHLETKEPNHQPSDEFRAQYQSAVRSLIYAMLGTRPDLAYSVYVVSRYPSRPNNSHWQAVKRVFRYLKGTLGLELTFCGNLASLVGFTNADWVGDRDTRRSTSGFMFNLGSSAISWSSKRQPTVALSSCEAEYMGQTQAIKEAVWLKSLLDQLSYSGSVNSLSEQAPTEFEDPPSALKTITIYCDNQGAVALAKNPESHARSKHIDIQWHYQKEKVEDGSVQLKYIPTEEQIADCPTKPWTKEKFLAFQKALGLEQDIASKN